MKMKFYFFNTYAIILFIILLLFSKINSQENQSSEEKQLLNNSLILFNKAEVNYKIISAKMETVKFNIFLKVRYKNLQRRYNNIRASIEKINNILVSNDYDISDVKEKLYDLKKDIEKFDKKCNKTFDVFSQSEKIKSMIINLIKVFFLTIVIIIIVVFAIIAIISYFIMKRQKKYQTLQEEVTNISGIEINVGNNINSQMDRLKEKNVEGNKKKATKKKKNVKKKEKKNKKDENND